MAISLTKQYTFSSNTNIASAQVNADLDDLYNTFSGLEALTKTFAKLKVDVDPSTSLEVATKQYVDHYAAYKRPRLTFQTVALVDVENNTGTLNQTVIPFPDGSQISVTEDTAVTNKYRRFDITATANFTSGTEDSGLYNGLTETANTWYAIYAVKSQINTANFVLVGTTTLPLQTNVSTLNTNLGANSWVYLGLIRNGDRSGATLDICAFVQHGDKTIFYNENSGNASNGPGILMASAAPATSATYTYAAGTTTAAIPNNVLIVDWVATTAAGPGTNFTIRAQTSSTFNFHRENDTPGLCHIAIANVPATLGLDNTTTNSVNKDIFLTGFNDLSLGVGSNPLI